MFLSCYPKLVWHFCVLLRHYPLEVDVLQRWGIYVYSYVSTYTYAISYTHIYTQIHMKLHVKQIQIIHERGNF